jgi:predicted RNA-binding protein with EMAP domain
MDSKENNSKNLPEKIDNPLKKAEQIVQNGKALTAQINVTASNVGNTINQSKELIGRLNDLKKTYLESEKIKSETKLGLERIKQNHSTINKHIDTEYKKQKQAMDKAGTVIDHGLESGDIELVKAGLDKMAGVANHNPLSDLKNHLDQKIDKDFEDDDFIIEI